MIMTIERRKSEKGTKFGVGGAGEREGRAMAGHDKEIIKKEYQLFPFIRKGNLSQIPFLFRFLNQDTKYS